MHFSPLMRHRLPLCGLCQSRPTARLRAAELQRRSDPAALHIISGASTDRTSTQTVHVDFSFGHSKKKRKDLPSCGVENIRHVASSSVWCGAFYGIKVRRKEKESPWLTKPLMTHFFIKKIISLTHSHSTSQWESHPFHARSHHCC